MDGAHFAQERIVVEVGRAAGEDDDPPSGEGALYDMAHPLRLGGDWDLLLFIGRCHVWTTLADQGLFSALRRSWMRSCLRPFARKIESAGPDVVRWSVAPIT